MYIIWCHMSVHSSSVEMCFPQCAPHINNVKTVYGTRSRHLASGCTSHTIFEAFHDFGVRLFEGH